MDNNELAAHQRAMHALLDRVRYLEHATTLVMTHHRDSLRHARSRNGNHLARVRNLLSRIFLSPSPTNGTRFIVLPSISPLQAVHWQLIVQAHHAILPAPQQCKHTFHAGWALLLPLLIGYMLVYDNHHTRTLPRC